MASTSPPFSWHEQTNAPPLEQPGMHTMLLLLFCFLQFNQRVARYDPWTASVTAAPFSSTIQLGKRCAGNDDDDDDGWIMRHAMTWLALVLNLYELGCQPLNLLIKAAAASPSRPGSSSGADEPTSSTDKEGEVCGGACAAQERRNEKRYGSWRQH